MLLLSLSFTEKKAEKNRRMCRRKSRSRRSRKRRR